MADESPKLVMEREAVFRERAAFLAGALFKLDNPHGLPAVTAATRYPLPSVRRLRRVTVPDLDTRGLGECAYRYNPDTSAYETRLDTHYAPWIQLTHVPVGLVEALADLKANPYKDVPE